MNGMCRVLIVDDSPTMRRLIRSGVESDPRIEIVGEADSAQSARDLVKKLSPDIMTLDVEMPGMDGLEFLARLMKARPMPVVMVSSLTKEGSETAVRALALGALECVEKPRFGAARGTFQRLADTLVSLSAAKTQTRVPTRSRTDLKRGFSWNGKTLLIGSSTGGVEALERVFSGFPEDCPPTLVTQHMPEQFLVSFAGRLNGTIAPTVQIADDGAPVQQGHILIAPGGDFHMSLDPNDQRKVRLIAGPKTSGHRPSVDVLFRSAQKYAPSITAALLTGMGKDGANGLLALRNAGASTFAQSEATCVVFGMPRVAMELGAVENVIDLQEMSKHLLAATSSKNSLMEMRQ